MSIVALLGPNHKGKLAVLALGQYSGLWRISQGAFTNDARVEFQITGRGTIESFFVLDRNVVAFSATIPEDKRQTFGRDDATVSLPAYTLELRCTPGVPLDDTAVAAITAVI